MMYCPNCKQEYEGKFCPECGTKLIEKPSGESGVSLNLGDANAISGGLNVSDSHAVHNEDKSVHNITNTTSTVNNITQMSVQKTEIELLQERKAQYLSACKRAYEDNVLEPSEEIELEELRIRIGLDKATAEEILDKVRVMSDRNARKSELNPIAKTKLKILTNNLQKNEVKALMDQIDSLEPLVRRYDNDELSRKYYLVLSALKPEKCIEQRESTKTDSYWESYWSYLAYIKEGRLIDAEETLASLDHFSSYPEDNMTVLAAAGELMMGHADEAKEYLDAATGEYTSALQRFVDSLFLLLAPEMAEEMGADENTCAFYLVNFFGKKDPKAQAEEEQKHNSQSDQHRIEPKKQRNKTNENEGDTKLQEENNIGKKLKVEDINHPCSKDIICDVILNSIGGSSLQLVSVIMKSSHLELKIVQDFVYKKKNIEDISLEDAEILKKTMEVYGAKVTLIKKEVFLNKKPSSKEELEKIIDRLVKIRGNNANLNDIDVSKLTDLSGLFANSKFNGDISQWDVSSVMDMSRMFENCQNFNSDLSQWDVSNVKDMHSMFANCQNFNSDLSQWDVSSVMDMSRMFANCQNLNSDLSQWDVSNVKNMRSMFENCQNFNFDLSKWNVSDWTLFLMR